MTNQAQKNFHTFSDFTKSCCIVMISHVSSRPNWYSTHAVWNKRIFFLFFFFNCYYFSDLETQWPQNPELKSRFCLPSTVIRGGKSQYWRKKKSQLCFRARNIKLQVVAPGVTNAKATAKIIQGLHDAERTYTGMILPRRLVSFLYGVV